MCLRALACGGVGLLWRFRHSCHVLEPPRLLPHPTSFPAFLPAPPLPLPCPSPALALPLPCLIHASLSPLSTLLLPHFVLRLVRVWCVCVRARLAVRRLCAYGVCVCVVTEVCAWQLEARSAMGRR